ncbi:MAG: right-handed parallel beta-helix repeat-containing protein [Kiritimatiellaeota bacterium]|nr:right-handed parallel beta-helix repeat-containing protein [Kiritimatiellota bacterium]
MRTQYLQRMLIGLGLTMVLAAPWASATNYYVVASSHQPSPTWPWTNWGWAHTNLIEVVAVARDNDTVYVTNNATYWLTNQITVSYAITVRSWGPGGILDPTDTILSGRYPNAINRHFTLNNAGAILAGLTLTKGYASGGGAIYLQNGMVTNCIIVSNVTYSSVGGGVYMTDYSGGVWNCTISGNWASNTTGNAGGIYVADGGGPWWIANCTISGNSTGYGCEGGGIDARRNTVISNCWIVSNVGSYSSGGIRLATGTVCCSSFIIGNSAVGYPGASIGGGIRTFHNGTLIRNCLIANNYAVGKGGAIQANHDVKIQNCTIASNVTLGNGGGFDFSGNAGFPAIENTIMWGNRAGADGSGTSSNYYITVGASTFTNCCTSPQIVSANATAVNTITNDPRFVNNATDFRLQSDSPCINAGVNRGWMEGVRDLYGYRRIDDFRKTVDIGAYEYLSPGTVFIGH